MKLLIVLCAVIGFSAALRLPQDCGSHNKYAGLYGAFKEIDCRLHWVCVDEATKKHENHPEVQHAAAYLNSNEFKGLVDRIFNNPGIVAIRAILDQSGVQYNDFLERLFELFGSNIKFPRARLATTYSQGIRGLFDDMIACFDLNTTEGVVDDLVKNNAEFRVFMQIVASNREVVEGIRQDPEYKNIAAQLGAWGIDTDRIAELVRKLFGWK
jgi:hypothetical protein